MDVSIDFMDETALLNAETLDGYKMLIVLRDGMIWPDGYSGEETTNAAWVATGRPKLVFDPPLPQPERARSQFWMKPEQGKAVRQFVDAGGAALFLHNTTHVGLSDPDFRHVLGAAYTGHPPIRTFKVKVTNRDNPIAKGVRDFVITDEQHYMTYDKDPKFLFLETVNEEGLTYQSYGATAPGGWSYDSCARHDSSKRSARSFFNSTPKANTPASHASRLCCRRPRCESGKHCLPP